jgi:exopolyphosphatase / guanosine-5'-triphosphate,3'-diphosphate pyrophosphatase
MSSLDASQIMVSGQGLREGVVYDSMPDGSPDVEDVRRASINALAARFSTWDRTRADRRLAIVRELLDSLEPKVGAGYRERMDQAATILDIGRSVDYYRRYEHTADMLTRADLLGFSHRKLAMLAAVVRQAGDETMRVQMYRPLLGPADRVPVARASAMLALADQVEHRMPPGQEGGIRCEVRARIVLLQAPVFDTWRRETLARRFQRVFGKRLVIQPNGRAAESP